MPRKKTSGNSLREFGDTELKKLRESMRWSQRKLKSFRDKNAEFIKEYVGFQYSENGTKDRVPVNMLALAVKIYTRSLVARTPQVTVSTPYKTLKPMAEKLRLATNHLANEIKLGDTLSGAAENAIFSIGVVKMGLSKTAGIEVDGFTHDPGQAFADVVDIDDFIIDMQSKTREGAMFIGDKYKLPLEYVQNSDLYDEKMRKDLKGSGKEGATGADETVSGKTANDPTVGDDKEPEEYREQVELWDVWLPIEGRLITIPVHQEQAKPLRNVEWDGPEFGPYHVLRFTDVPSNPLPLSPVAMLIDLHDIINRLFRKTARQAERQKTITAYSGGAVEDAKRVRDASDGEMIRMDNPERVKEYKSGGADNVSVALLLNLMNKFSYIGGNIDTIGGLASQTDTVGQENLLAANSSTMVQDMQDAMVTFTTGIMRDLAFYLFYDPVTEIPMVKRVPGVNIDIPTTWTPEEREGDYLDYNFNVAPYSLQAQSPSQKLKTLMGIFQSVLAPGMPFMAQQGIFVNWDGLLRTVARYADMDELDDILVFQEPSAEGSGPIGQPPQKSPVTTRNYTRKNIPGAGRQQQDQTMANMLMGNNAQPAEKATLVRPTG